jgi:hypothetical protein
MGAADFGLAGKWYKGTNVYSPVSMGVADFGLTGNKLEELS